MAQEHDPTILPAELVARYVLECKGQGQFLPYDDYNIINDWLSAVKHVDELLLILDEVLPMFFSPEKKRIPRSLKGAHQKVLKKIKENALMSSL